MVADGAPRTLIRRADEIMIIHLYWLLNRERANVIMFDESFAAITFRERVNIENVQPVMISAFEKCVQLELL
jgi:hypothetical protein